MEVSREEGVVRGMAPRGKERTTVGDAALSAGKHRWALLRAQERHPCGDVLGEEWELVAPPTSRSCAAPGGMCTVTVLQPGASRET